MGVDLFEPMTQVTYAGPSQTYAEAVAPLGDAFEHLLVWVFDGWYKYDPADPFSPVQGDWLIWGELHVFPAMIMFVTRDIYWDWDAGPAPPGYPKADIVTLAGPGEVVIGRDVLIVVALMNVGPVGGALHPVISWYDSGVYQSQGGEFQEVAPGSNYIWSFKFTMPPESLNVYAEAYSWDNNAGSWTRDDIMGPLVVTAVDIPILLPPDAPEYISKPGWLKDILDIGILNLHAGEWGSVGPLKFPPWDFKPGEAIEQGLDLVLSIINSVIAVIADVVDSVQGALDAALLAWGHADGAWGKITGFITAGLGAWWSSTFEIVKTYIGGQVDWIWGQLADIGGKFAEVWSYLDDLKLSPDGILELVLDRLPMVDWIVDIKDKAQTAWEFVLAVPGDFMDFFDSPVDYFFDKLEGWLFEPEVENE